MGSPVTLRAALLLGGVTICACGRVGYDVPAERAADADPILGEAGPGRETSDAVAPDAALPGDAPSRDGTPTPLEAPPPPRDGPAPVLGVDAPALRDASPDAPAARDAGVDGPRAVDAAETRDTGGPDAGAPDGAAIGGTLLGYWRFDEGAGLVAADSSGQGNHAMIKGTSAPVWRAGRRGGALALGQMDGWAEVAASASLDSVVATQAFTMAAWVFRQVAHPTLHHVIASRQAGGTNREHLGFGMLGDSHTMAIAGVGPGDYGYAPVGVPVRQWHHVAATRDAAALRVYLDGALLLTVVQSGPVTTDENPLILGGNINDPARRDVQENLEALVDDLVIYRRALDPQEIARLAAGDAPPTR
jgi:hypothetical protein